MGLYTNNSGSNTNNSGYIWLYDGICIHYWLVVEPYPSEKYAKVSWDDDIPNIWKNKSHVPNHLTRLIQRF